MGGERFHLPANFGRIEAGFVHQGILAVAEPAREAADGASAEKRVVTVQQALRLSLSASRAQRVQPFQVEQRELQLLVGCPGSFNRLLGEGRCAVRLLLRVRKRTPRTRAFMPLRRR